MRKRAAIPIGWVGWILTIGAPALAQSQAVAADDPVEVLVRVRDQVAEHGQRIPNHTCIETVERDRFEPAGGRAYRSCDTLLAGRKRAAFSGRLQLDATDRLRLDVAVAGGREIYSWAGANRFEEGEIDQLIRQGAMGTGIFANLLLSVFDSPVPGFTFAGPTMRDVTRLLQYSFDIPLELSHYRAKAGQTWLNTGYTGMLLVDPRTADLIRFTARTEELPASTGLCEVDASLDYGTVPLGGIDYLMPVATVQRFIATDGAEGENRIKFGSCREFHGESQVEFGAPPAAGKPSPGAPAAAPRLPAGLPVTVEIEDTIDSSRAAAGDRIAGRLVKPIVDPQKNVLVQQGAALQGRLMLVELRYRKSETVLAVRWETLERNGVMEPVAIVPAAQKFELAPFADRRHGVYRFPGKWPTIQSGFRSQWITDPL